MAKKKKAKKQKKLNIPIQTMARPRLEQIMVRCQSGELDDETTIALINELMAEIGREAVLNALVGLLDNADDEQKEALMVIIPKLGDKQTIEHLWKLVRRSKLSVGAKMTALVILKQMGEEVNLEDPGEYFSWRDIKNSDIVDIENIGRFALRGLTKELQKFDSADDVEAFILDLEEYVPEANRADFRQEQIAALIEMGDPPAADMLTAFLATSTHPDVRQAARNGLLKLAGNGVFPQSEVIKSLHNEPFHSAYSTDPANPWQQGVIMVWERPQKTVQAMVFLLDFGQPWLGGIKDMFPTYSMPFSQLKSQMIDKPREQGAAYRRITYGRARKLILGAIEASRKNRVEFPEEVQKYFYLVERRIIDPSPEAVAYAEQVDANTVDEWGELEEEPVRGMEIIGPDGTPMPVIRLGDLEGWEDEEYEPTIEDILDDVESFYESNQPDEAEEADEDIIDAEALLPSGWLVDYLTTRFNEGFQVVELDERLDNLCEFILYLGDEEYAPPETMADIQGYHLSEFIIGYWENEVWGGKTASVGEREFIIDSVQDLYDYLAEQGHIPADAAKRVEQAATTLFSSPNELTAISR